MAGEEIQEGSCCGGGGSPGRGHPHLSAFVVPLTQDGRLSAKEFIGGRSKMREDQSTYAESVKKLGLERGIEEAVPRIEQFSTTTNR